MNADTQEQFAEVLVRTLLSEKIIPTQVLAQMGNLVSANDATFLATVRKHWEKLNQERVSAGGSPRNIDLPIHLTRGFDEDTAEEELGRVLPEEKILINREIFRLKLKAVDFSSLDSRKEQALIESLTSDSIGMSRDETVLYFNLIKISALSGQIKRPSASAQAMNYPATILRLAQAAFNLSPAILAKMNGGKPIENAQLTNILEIAIKQNKLNPKVLSVLLGHKTDKYLKKLVRFLEFVVTQRGEEPQEVIQHFGFYLLVNTAEESMIKTLELTTPLHMFVTNRIGRVREVYYLTMLFAITFFVVLLSQVTEIAGKFQESPPDQQAKLMKLYQSDERLAMLVQNAVNLANRRISDYSNKVEGREVQSNLKRFLSSNADLVTAADLFKTDYRMEGSR
jgi:hypothetical protein